MELIWLKEDALDGILPTGLIQQSISEDNQETHMNASMCCPCTLNLQTTKVVLPLWLRWEVVVSCLKEVFNNVHMISYRVMLISIAYSVFY